jgi:DeoR/GlpR family transcriptional regulator of sugar metabolism
MFVHDRHQVILQHLLKKPRWSIDALLRELPVSRSTLRRDLVDLERRRSVIRVHGGVMRPDFVHGELTFDRRQRQHEDEKQSIARMAAAIVPEQASVYLDAGTTTLRVAELLLPRRRLRLFTHSLRVMNLATTGHAAITCLGGEHRPGSDALVGNLTLKWLENLRFDVAIIGASAVGGEGAFTTELSECSVKQRILQRTGKSILVCDSSKWNGSAAVHFADWKDFHTWVCDAGLPTSARQEARRHGIPLELAQQQKGAAA